MALLQTVDLKRYFGETRAVDNVNLSIEEGEFVSLVGPNGAGKTSLINVISARLTPEFGQDHLQGRGHHASVRDATRQGRHRAQLPARQRVRRSHHLRQRGAGNLLARGQDRASWQPSPTSITPLPTRPMRSSASSAWRQSAATTRATSSQGERKLLDVALAYALKPKLLFLDEPTSGVSTRDKGQIMDTIASVVRGEGITAVIVEHDMDVVFKYSDRIVVMAQGAILAQGTPDEIRKNEQVAMVLLGSSGPDAFTRKD